MEPIDYSTINPGIRALVRLLRAIGLNTTDSGDGFTNLALGMDALDIAHVHSVLPAGVPDPRTYANDVAHYLKMAGLPVTGGTVQLMYDPEDEVTTLSVYGLNDSMLVGP